MPCLRSMIMSLFVLHRRIGEGYHALNSSSLYSVLRHVLWVLRIVVTITWHACWDIGCHQQGKTGAGVLVLSSCSLESTLPFLHFMGERNGQPMHFLPPQRAMGERRELRLFMFQACRACCSETCTTYILHAAWCSLPATFSTREEWSFDSSGKDFHLDNERGRHGNTDGRPHFWEYI